MDSPHSNPRRRNSYNTSSSATSHQPIYTSNASTLTNLNHSLKKSSTFHAPNSPSGEHDPILNIPSLPRRSFTSAKELEALVAGDDRIAQIIGAVDRSLSGLENFVSDSQDTLVAETHPVPLFMLHANIGNPDHTEIDHDQSSTYSSFPHRSGLVKKHHTSDSGIGSTVSSSETSMSVHHAGMKPGFATHNPSGNTTSAMPFPMNEGRVQTGINGLTVGAPGSVAGSQHVLSEYACKQIEKHIIKPIVGEPRLKDFHSLVKGIPFRVARKEITCLRDLEKVLLWLAPKWSTTKASFLHFCETSIQCIHATVDNLSESDQRRPTDRPYTNGYFLDLVEQVRQYATMLAASRARIASNPGSAAEKHPEERLELVGGLGQTGRVAELVRTTNDGSSVSLRTGERISPEEMSARYKHGMKRSVSEESDEDVMRSMARRRKSAQPAVKDIQKCSDCNKVFKRPCDLTKHEKTHSRPWKCSDNSCKYYEYGWPTEKERDRHVNDKHSATPSMYKCQFTPCPYESKRESNCKQHMEKAHGWQYVRSKNNGKASKRPQSGRTPPTPQMSTPGSHIFNSPTPEFHDSPAFYEHPMHGSTEPMGGSSMVPGPYPVDTLGGFSDTFGPIDPNVWPDASHEFVSGNGTEYTSSSHRPSWDASMTDPSAPPSAFQNSMDLPGDDSLFGDNYDWSNMNHNLTSHNMQLMTPATSANMRPFDAFSRNPSISHDERADGQIPSLSPGAQGDAMLYTPYSMQSNDVPNDEGYVEFHNDMFKPRHDFSLFVGSNATASVNITTNEMMFQDLSTFSSPPTWSGRGTELAHQLGMTDLMQMDEE